MNNVKVTDAAARLGTADVLPGGLVMLRRGRRTVGAIRVAGPDHVGVADAVDALSSREGEQNA